MPDTAICSRFGSTRVGRAVPGRLFMTGVLPLTYTGATGAVLLVAVFGLAGHGRSSAPATSPPRTGSRAITTAGTSPTHSRKAAPYCLPTR